MKVKVTKDSMVLYDGKIYKSGDVIDYGDGVQALLDAGHVKRYKEKK